MGVICGAGEDLKHSREFHEFREIENIRIYSWNSRQVLRGDVIYSSFLSIR